MNGMQAGFYKNPQERVEARLVRAWLAEPVAVDHYARAAASLGLWRSEEKVFRGVFRLEDRLLDVGCGAGRVALGLARLGFAGVVGIDNCTPMVMEARRLAEAMGLAVEFWDGDALALPFQAGSFAGAIFGFNGLMQIPGREHRRQALREVRKVVAPGGSFVFTTHDRDLPGQVGYWRDEAERWRRGTRNPALVEFGDRVIDNPEGRIFIHVPDRAEVVDDLASTGWTLLEDHPRSAIANEPEPVREFADECRFWIARRAD
ncbi:MAG: class I SAM-dependent methyltransferase [Opitutaceae bacterium]|nr:class I SAM-dependent methyltransferase [Opitutaceae bacterium]